MNQTLSTNDLVNFRQLIFGNQETFVSTYKISLVSPKRVVRCRGGNRYVEGKGFLIFGFLVSWLLRLLVSWFRSFLVSKFLGFKISQIQWSHITKLPCYVFWKILIPYPRFSNNIKRIAVFFSAPVFFRKIPNARYPTFFKFINKHVCKNNLDCLGSSEVSWGLQK